MSNLSLTNPKKELIHVFIFIERVEVVGRINKTCKVFFEDSEEFGED